MARTYTVHGHFKRRDGRQEAFWTRTGLTKAQAQALAKEQRSEAGGVAKIVPEGAAHATKKTPPAQLEREINEALSRHKQARDRWLSLQAGPLYRERQAAYDEMSARAQEARSLEKKAPRTHHAVKQDRRKIRYVSLSWSDPNGRYREGNFPQTDVDTILEGLFQRGIHEVAVEDRAFSLASLDDVHAAAKHAHDSVMRRGRSSHSTKKSSSGTNASAKDYRVLVRVQGAPKPVHVSPWMTLSQAEHAAKNHKAMIRDRGWTQVVEIEDTSGAVTRIPR
jgi:hypothetical protein